MKSRIEMSNSFPGRKPVLLALALLCQSCVSDFSLPWPPGDSEEMPAASYYQWVESATAAERQQELARLQARTSGAPEVVTLVQRAIVLYYQDGNGRALADLNLTGPALQPCNDDRLCRDYAAFAGLFRELADLESALEDRRAETSALQDRIRVLNQQIEALTNIEQQLLERERRQD